MKFIYLPPSPTSSFTPPPFVPQYLSSLLPLPSPPLKYLPFSHSTRESEIINKLRLPRPFHGLQMPPPLPSKLTKPIYERNFFPPFSRHSVLQKLLPLPPRRA